MKSILHDLAKYQQPTSDQTIYEFDYQSQAISPFPYANILYPIEIIEIMETILGPPNESAEPIDDPESTIDLLLANWLNKIPNQHRYLLQLLEAIVEKGCADCLMARINLDCLINSGTRIVKIVHTPKCHPYWPGNEIQSTQAQTLHRQLIPQFKQWLLNSGFKWTNNANEAQLRLESQLKNRNLEQLILGRIAFLALCYVSKVGSISPTPQLTLPLLFRPCLANDT